MIKTHREPNKVFSATTHITTQILYRLFRRMGENHLKLFMPLYLKELGLRKVAVLFCRKSDVLDFFSHSLYSRLPTCEIKEWLKVTEKRMSKLGLPESLNKQVIDRIQAIGFGIREWKEDNRLFRSEAEIELPDVSKFCWTTTGEIDDRKIAEQYVLCDRLEDRRRYELACRNCTENHIPLLWHKLSERDKKRYEIDVRLPRLERCWPCILEGEQSKLDDLWRESSRNLTSFNQWAFEKSAIDGNQVAVEYFFHKLTPEEREVSLMRTACDVCRDVLFYLLSVMTPEQQMRIVKARPVRVLWCFLDWKRRHLLPENAGLIWTFLQESDYGDLLAEIMFTLRRRDNIFPKLFQEFFKNAPLACIKSFVGDESDSCSPAGPLLRALIINGDSESIEVMFRHVDAASKVKLIFCEGVFHCFLFCIVREKWQGVEACLREAALSEEYKDTLKESFMRFLDKNGPAYERLYKSQRRNIGRFFELLHETGASDDKEKKVKRLKLE